MKIIIRLLFIVLGIVVFQSAFAAKPKPAKFIVTGYVNSNWIKSETDLGFIPNLDRICFFGLSPDETGAFTVRDNYLKNYELIRSGMVNGQKILLVVGGGGLVANMHIMGNDPVKREIYIKEVVAFAIKHKFDGIDIDWEIDGATKPKTLVPTENLIAMLTSIKKQMPENSLLTATLAGASVQQAVDVLNYVDDVSLRYYASLNKEGLHAPLYTVKEGLQKYKALNGTENKVLVGVPFYGRGAEQKTIFYKDIVNHLALGDSITAIYDGCSFNSVQIMRDKVRYFKKQGYKGIMIWEITQDAPYSHPMSLLRAICSEAKAASSN